MPLPELAERSERLYGPAELPTSDTLLYTAPGSRTITDIYVTETGGATPTITIYIVPATDDAASANKFLGGFSTIANDMRPVTGLKIPILAGEKIYGSASGTGVNLIIVGTMR